MATPRSPFMRQFSHAKRGGNMVRGKLKDNNRHRNNGDLRSFPPAPAFRCIDAAASLKLDDQHQLLVMVGSFRGIVAAASLKRVNHAQRQDDTIYLPRHRVASGMW